jgi:CRISPR type I-E-associated protein CasB/Cse2
MSEANFDPRVLEFCERLSRLDTGERARLKRNVGRPLAESHNALGLFFRLLPPNVPTYQEGLYFLVATLFPLASGGGEGNFGASLFRARDARYAQGLDRRVEILLDADPEQLRFRLRQAVCFLESRRVAVNWPRLLQDVLAWENPKRYVQEQWARSYFVGQG